MRLTITYYLLLSVVVLHFYKLNAESNFIHITTSEDYEVLDKFFRFGILEEEYYYVLDGSKPISIRNFYPPWFSLPKNLDYAEKEIANTLLVHEAIPVWQKLCSSQKNFVFKSVSLNPPGSLDLGWEVQFINISKLQEVIEKNITIFRYILGPTVQTKDLVNQIAYSKESLSDILLHNSTLEGIVLGFGTHNSIVGGRAETINSMLLSRDIAPFVCKSLLQGDQRDYYGLYYLEAAGGNHSLFDSRNESIQIIKPSVGHSSIEEELLAIHATNETLPSCLMEKPKFIFGAFSGGESNQSLFEKLIKSQKQAQILLNQPDFLEQVLKKIAGTQPLITCKKPVSSDLQLSFFRGKMSHQIWKEILDQVVKVNCSKDENQRLSFIASFSNPSTSPSVPPIIGASKTLLEGLKKAFQYLSHTNTYFNTLSESKDASLQIIAPHQLYFKTIDKGFGKELKGFDHVRIGYVITDLEGNVLFANYDTWLHLSDTIPGFVHGLQGMREGEKRDIFIHPALAYGALTTLPPCIGLIAKVKLHEIDEKISKPLPSLISMDLSWIKNSSLLRNIEESIQQLPLFVGSFYRRLLNKIEGFDQATLIAELYSPTNSQN